ncbi:hypothetical protein Glove_267g24 [Diversispora epigaea]|uniref:Uncharacterized protein n=1 Tax=Diversispora epigaea TaxID=1348612 RepID=A0A397I5E7_9GLOM|nr:hypothetical protein Glove_267g24 [Diversispora epigaea]
MSSNIVNLNEDSFETQTVDESCINIDENDIDEVVLVSKIFEFNEIEIECNENLESDSEYNFESNSSDNKKELENQDDENDIIIEQKLSNNLTPCVIIDKIDRKIQRCKNVESFQKLWQLIGVWQIDSNVILEANGFLKNLGVCSYHFNHDQNKLHNSKDKQLKSTSVSILNRCRCLFCRKLFYFFTRGNGCSKHSRKLLDKNIQIICNGQHTCNALGECYPICKLAFEDIKNPRYICSECYELEGGHFYVKPGKGKLSVSCIKQKYHDNNVKKNIEIIACWLLHVKDTKIQEEQEKILKTFPPLYFQFLNENYLDKINKNQFDISVSTNQTQSIAKSSNTPLDTLIPALTKLPSFFMKNIEIIACWLLHVKDTKIQEEQEKILKTFPPLYFQFLNENYLDKINKNQFDISVSTNQTQSIAKSSNTPLDTLIPALTKLPSFFMVRTLTRLN